MLKEWIWILTFWHIEKLTQNGSKDLNIRAKTIKFSEEKKRRASRVAQWLGVCLPMQGTRVRALVREDPTCRGAAGPVSHNY